MAAECQVKRQCAHGIHIHQQGYEVPAERYMNNYVRDEVCGARKCRDLGVELLGDDVAIAAMDAATRGMDEKQCFTEMFKLWRERSGSQASWTNLIKALRNINLNRIANNVENFLTPPKRDDREPQNQETIKRIFRGRRLAELNGEYAKAVNKIKDDIEKAGFEISYLLLNLNTIDADNSTIFSTDAASNITTIDDLFFEIGKYCNIYNYDLLSSLLHSINCEGGIQILDKFTYKMQNSVLHELDLLNESEKPDIPVLQPGMHKLVIKYIGNRCTIEKERLIRSVICECFKLTTWSLTFDFVHDGCIALVYHISSVVKSHLLQHKITAKDAALLKKFQIKSIKIDNTVLKISPLSLFGLLSEIRSALGHIYHVKQPFKWIMLLILLILALLSFINDYQKQKLYMMQLEEGMMQEIANIQNIFNYINEMNENFREQAIELNNARRFQRNFPVVDVKQEIAELLNRYSQAAIIFNSLAIKVVEIKLAVARLRDMQDIYKKLGLQNVEIEKFIQDFELQRIIEFKGGKLFIK